MDVPNAAELADRLRAQPRTARVVEAFAATPGAHLVGGAVRDLLLGGEPVDLDVVVEGVARPAVREAASRLGGDVREHDRFGTFTVVAGDLAFDVVTARTETYPEPGALPEVGPGTLEDDLARRDFTVNAIAVALHEAELGALTEHPGALDDLDARALRVLHAKSFLDDPTRLLRLVRYGARLDFEPEQRTDALARDAVADGAVATVSGGRIGNELRLLTRERTALAALTRVEVIGLDRALHPSLEPRLDLAERALEETLEEARSDLVILAACATRFEREELRRWLDALEYEAAERDAVVAAALDAEILAERLEHAHLDSALRHLALGRPAEELALAGALGAGEAVARWRDRVRSARLRITGDDLLAAGAPQGPAIGAGLDEAWRVRLDEGVEDRDEQLAAALQAARGE